MYSLNVPVPGRVAATAREIAADLPAAQARVRGQHTLGVKRLSSDDRAYSRIEARTRELLSGQPAFEARIDGIGVFENPSLGSAPVVYLAVDSPGLHALHETLLSAFDPVNEQIEGDGYTPHVTVARGGSLETARRVAAREIEPIEWTVTELHFWDAKREQSVSTVSLPA